MSYGAAAALQAAIYHRLVQESQPFVRSPEAERVLNRLEIEQLTAKAGDGTVQAKGFISLASADGYPLNISIDPLMYAATLLAMVLLTMLASSWVARKTVHLPVVDALAHT